MQPQLIRYDLLVQDALRGMVRDLLVKAARDGLPGDHHFFISFKTHAPGVQLSSRMKARYPEEIRIVLQHQFWDLTVSDKHFEVGLSFSNIPERLVVPFAALTGFHDPTVPFMLKFEPKEEVAADPGPQSGDEAAQPAAAPAPFRLEAKQNPARRASDAPSAQDASPEAQTPAKAAGGEADPAAPGEAAKVVSIDAFRKKP